MPSVFRSVQQGPGYPRHRINLTNHAVWKPVDCVSMLAPHKPSTQSFGKGRNSLPRKRNKEPPRGCSNYVDRIMGFLRGENPNLEIRNKSEMQNPNVPNGSLCLGFGLFLIIRSFEFVSDFEIRISDLLRYFSQHLLVTPPLFENAPNRLCPYTHYLRSRSYSIQFGRLPFEKF